VPEEFTLQQTAGNSSTVEFDQPLLLTAAAIVKGAGNEFLARARLSQQEHGGITRGYGFHQLQYLPESRTVTDDAFEIRLAVDLFFRRKLVIHAARRRSSQQTWDRSARPPMPARCIRGSSWFVLLLLQPIRNSRLDQNKCLVRFVGNDRGPAVPSIAGPLAFRRQVAAARCAAQARVRDEPLKCASCSGKKQQSAPLLGLQRKCPPFIPSPARSTTTDRAPARYVVPRTGTSAFHPQISCGGSSAVSIHRHQFSLPSLNIGSSKSRGSQYAFRMMCANTPSYFSFPPIAMLCEKGDQSG
jgi:hypothetical protein